MQQQAQSFRLPLRDLALDGLDADRDLLWRLPHRGTERALQLDAGAFARVRLRVSLDARGRVAGASAGGAARRRPQDRLLTIDPHTEPAVDDPETLR
jgi:hypothetical protein